MNVALVYDRVNKIGGAERVLTALHECFPDAPLYTAVYDPKDAPWAQPFRVKTTFMQHIPFARRHHEWFAWLTPFAFESLSFDGFDLVISVTSAEAKGLVTKPETLHLCYCLTPTRYLWTGADLYARDTGFGLFHGLARRVFRVLLPTLRSWDLVASTRPDVYVGISRRVQERIRTYYHRDSTVLYPPVDTDVFVPSEDKPTGSYYLVVSRLVPYKRLDIIVRVCTKLGKELVVIGSGSQRDSLRASAGPTIRFVEGNLTDQSLLGYYQQCRAFLFAGDEDFGLVAAEAQSCGRPVIAFADSGVAEIIQDGVTGILFSEQSEAGLTEAIHRFEALEFSRTAIRKRALRFSRGRFKKEFMRLVRTHAKRHHSFL